jgi:small subunit ribosomal protein S16
MAVKIRLTRTGKKKQPSYRVVVMDSRKPRDGKYIEQIGRYDARQEPSLIEIDNERALVWLHQGAQPTERAQKLLEISGAWAQFRVDRGEIHTVGDHEPTAYPEKSAIVEVLAESAEEVTSDQLPVPSDEDAGDQASETAEATSEAIAEEAADEAVEGTAEEVAGEEATADVSASAAEGTAEALAEAAEGTDEQEDSA